MHVNRVRGIIKSERSPFSHAGCLDMNSDENALPQLPRSTSYVTRCSMDPSMVVSAPTRGARSEGLGAQEPGSCDSNDALANLLATATAALDTDPRAAKNCIQRAAALLGIDLAPGGDGAGERSCRHVGLAAWQAKRLRAYIEDKLDSSIRATDLADVLQLSTSHFFRAFRKTFGEPPLRYIMQRRIRRAQELMLASRLPLSQVALECGMCDQAHLCRVFRRIVGINPNAWRRQFPIGPAPDGTAAREISIKISR
jgi:AraC family transcriptional regulator